MSEIKVLTHSSIRLQGDGKVVYADPFQVEGQPHDADVILVTHEHYDHFSPEDIARVAKKDTVLVAPRSMEAKAAEAAGLVAQLFFVQPKEKASIEGLPLEAVPAYNVDKHFHPKENAWVGYILTLEGERLYIAGDTDANEDNRRVRCDVALVPVGGTYTMTAREAAAFVNDLRPKRAIPTHYGNIVGKAEDAESFLQAVDPGIQVEVQLK